MWIDYARVFFLVYIDIAIIKWALNTSDSELDEYKLAKDNSLLLK
jgi:hypothetical protein